MRHRPPCLYVLAPLLAAAAVLPAPASAQLFDWGQQCMPTLPQACVSISLRTEYVASLDRFGGRGATTFQLWVENTTGGSFGFRSFGVLDAAYTPDPDGFGSTLLGQDACSGCSEHDLGGADTESVGHWAIDGWPSSGTFGTPSISFSRHYYEAIFGCDAPATIEFAIATTCGGSVRIDDFFLPGRWEITADSRFQIDGGYYEWAGRSGGLIHWEWEGVQCHVGETCTSVPEPGSLPLMATGLALLALAGRRTRDLPERSSSAD